MALPDSSLIDEYLLGRMSSQEQAEFERMIKSDAELAVAVQKRKETISAVELIGDHILKAKVKAVHDKNMPIIRRKRRRMYAAVAVIGLALIALAYYFSSPSSIQAEAVFASTFKAYEYDSNTRSQENVPSLTQFSEQYKNEEYRDALQTLNTIPDSLITYEVLFVKANALLALEEAEDAIPIFENLLQDPIYGEYSRWYLALGLLQQGQLERSCQVLREIQKDSAHFNHREASRILKVLE